MGFLIDYQWVVHCAKEDDCLYKTRNNVGEKHYRKQNNRGKTEAQTDVGVAERLEKSKEVVGETKEFHRKNNTDDNNVVKKFHMTESAIKKRTGILNQ